MVNSGVVAAIHVLGMRCDPYGAMRWTVSPPPTCIDATTPELTFGILNSVF